MTLDVLKVLVLAMIVYVDIVDALKCPSPPKMDGNQTIELTSSKRNYQHGKSAKYQCIGEGWLVEGKNTNRWEMECPRSGIWPLGPPSCKDSKPRTCLDLLSTGKSASGVYTLFPNSNDQYTLNVFCDQETDGGGWTVFQRRMDGSVDFYRNWQNYKLGFGDVNGEHWLGNDKLSLLLSLHKNNELRIDMEAVSNEKAYAKYNNFNMGDKSTDYTLAVSGYNGTAGDSLAHHNAMKFSTFDIDNDNADASCASAFYGAWWYNECHHSNLNGNYHNGAHESYADGVNWYHWKGHNESLKTTEMKFRPRL